jgi:hypothetical protein
MLNMGGHQGIQIIGSGSAEPVIAENNVYQIFCNTSIVRACRGNTFDCLFLSDGQLQTDEVLKSHPPTISLNNDESFLMRKDKRDFYNGCRVNKIVVVSSKCKEEIEKLLSYAGIQYYDLKIINYRKRSFLLAKFLTYDLRLLFSNIGYVAGLKFFFSLLMPFQYKPPSSVSPSTGMVAVLAALLKAQEGQEIILDGIGGKSVDAFYPSTVGGKYHNKQFQFNRVHKVDSLIMSKLIRDKII